jgi:hypothetical protein
MNIPDRISESSETIFGVQNTSFDEVPDPGSIDPEWKTSQICNAA